MRFPKRLVELAVKLYHDGLTLARSRKRVSEIFDITVKAFSTVWYWAKRFASQTSRIIEGLAERLHCDETLIKTFQKRRFLYFWAVKCPATKVIVGWHLSEHRTLRDAKLLFWEARRKFPVGYFPKSIRTDSMPAYRFAISKVFSHEVKHEKVISFKHGNNVIETFWRCKRRFPRFRTMESARSYLAQIINEYNSEKLGILEMFIIRLLKATRSAKTMWFLYRRGHYLSS